MAERDDRARSILGDFSVSQIVATGLAAATSFALSAQIGIAGSIIGAVIGAVASSVATQVYRNILSASAEKLRSITPDMTSRTTPAGRTRVMPAPSPADETERVAPSGTPIAPPELSEAARGRERARLARRVAVFAALAAVAVVLVYALVVNLATRGEGIGPSLSPSEPIVVEEQVPESPAPEKEAEKTPEQPTEPTEEPSEPVEGEGATVPEDNQTGENAPSGGETSGPEDQTDLPTNPDSAPDSEKSPDADSDAGSEGTKNDSSASGAGAATGSDPTSSTGI